MLNSFLSILYVFVCILIILLILVQRGKGSMGLGSLGGGTQMLFGGSGGQDLFQKITWIFGFIMIFGSLSLSLLKVSYFKSSGYRPPVERRAPAQPANSGGDIDQ